LSQLTPESLAALKKAYRILFRLGLPLKHAVARVREELETPPEVEYLLEFIETSKRGIGFSQPNRILNG
jgi:UDP-N-acetylglucosamine acyltransferase